MGFIETLNPADIESITVLKDAASASLYGAKGAKESCLSLLKKERKASFVSIWRRNTESQISLIHIVR